MIRHYTSPLAHPHETPSTPAAPLLLRCTAAMLTRAHYQRKSPSSCHFCSLRLFDGVGDPSGRHPLNLQGLAIRDGLRKVSSSPSSPAASDMTPMATMNSSRFMVPFPSRSNSLINARASSSVIAVPAGVVLQYLNHLLSIKLPGAVGIEDGKGLLEVVDALRLFMSFAWIAARFASNAFFARTIRSHPFEVPTSPRPSS